MQKGCPLKSFNPRLHFPLSPNYLSARLFFAIYLHKNISVDFGKGTKKAAKTRGLCCCKMIFPTYFNPNKAKYLIELFTFCYFILVIEQKSTIFAANMF